MGFFGKVGAATKGGAAIDWFERLYYEQKALDHDLEPYQFMASQWNLTFQRAGNPVAASLGSGMARWYGCLPSPVCVRMFGHHLCCYLIPEFSECCLMNDWMAGMRDVLDLVAACNADRLNALFRAYNPRSYDEYVRDCGEPPFVAESMWQSRKVLYELMYGSSQRT